jgi:hypothetical protein
MVFKFGKKVADLIEQQIKPEYGNPCNPYDLFEGKNFGVHVRKVGDWNNYDLCQFVGEKGPISIDGTAVEKSDDDQKRIADVKFAFNQGASHIVVGRPITQNENPAIIARKFNKLMHEFK